jgi:short-subunit dehydrogenase
MITIIILHRNQPQEKSVSQGSTVRKPAVLVTGASTGIGAVYADRFAKRGHDLVLVARDRAKLDVLAARLRGETGVGVDVLKADLTEASQLDQVEMLLRDDDRIGILVNNAGATLPGTFIDQTTNATANLIGLNTVAVTRLAGAVAPRFVKAGATKAFVLFLSQGLNVELGPKGVYVQAVLPAATRTDIWAKSGRDINAIPGMMDVAELVDAALVGFDRRETVTIPPLPDEAQWQTFDAARKALLPGFGNARAGLRYQADLRTVHGLACAVAG